MNIRSRATKTVAMSALVASAVALSGCGADDSADKHNHEAGAEPIALTYDGGILVLDGKTLEQQGEVKLEGFNRINPAGDDHHLMVTHKDTFKVFDAYDAKFTDIEFTAAKPGHVVNHAGRTVLFADGSGETTSFDSKQLESGKPETKTYKAAAPHHGVSIELANGQLVTTLGTEDKRVGVVVLDADRKEIARTEDCPGVHGEATAQGEAVVIGCQTGVVVYRDGKITKVTSPDPYGRIGNQAGTEVSAVVLGDYKKDKDAELERPTQVSLIDTVTGTLKLVDLGTSYTFRSLGRGPAGEALVLGTDGKIHVIDPIAGKVTKTIPVLDSWSEPLKWQQARPALFVRGDTAYVSDPATKKVYRIDLAAGTVAASTTLPSAPNEISGVVAH
ncbi:zinc metallochaperone AztD [Nocardia sp. XZ_19_385]|uniref:zinc metallochaperone AztD n=1 Tax=Nocardia sp. XZ_19_385 TaxID=2769488 RepID=UPI00188E5AA4|nr:zinc metallochaperone AztD [Nocardia sp. XZ_19_385]